MRHGEVIKTQRDKSKILDYLRNCIGHTRPHQIVCGGPHGPLETSQGLELVMEDLLRTS